MSPAIVIGKEQTFTLRKALSFPVVMSGLLVCVTFCFCCLRFSDPDTWWHLKMGQEIWNTHAIPRADHWSYTVFGQPWVAHEWLAQLSIYAAYLLGGYQGLQLWMCVLASSLVVVAYILCYRYCGNPAIAMLGGVLVFFFGTIGFSIRPQMIGYLLLALELLVLERAWSGRPKALWLLPVIFVVWVNCHGSYALGLGIFVLAALCSYIGFRRSGFYRGPEIRLLAPVFIACCIALALNPIGIKLLAYPLNVFVKQRASLEFLSEWVPLSMLDVRGTGVLLVLAAMAVAGLRGRAKATAFELLVLLPVSLLAMQHLRMVFVFGIVCAPIACRMLADLHRPKNPQPCHLPTNAFLLLLAAASCYAVFPGSEKIATGVAYVNPVKAVQFIRQSGIQGPMLNDYTWGGYLVWALPEHKVFIDGRGDVFDWAGVVARYRDWFTLHEDPARLLDDYRINFCLLPVSSPLANVVPHLRGWKTLYSDKTAVVFARE